MKRAKMEAAMDGNACFAIEGGGGIHRRKGVPRNACAVFAAFALAASTVFGATYDWTGSAGTEWNTASSWTRHDKTSEHAVPTGGDSTSHNADIRNSYFASGAERLITFSAARKMYWKTHLRNAGSEENPVVFRASADSYGLKAGANTKSTGVRGWFIAFDEDVGPAWLKLERGTYCTGDSYGHWYIGSGTYEGHVVAESGVKMSASAGIELCNGSLELNGATATSGVKIIIGGRGNGSYDWNKSFANVKAKFTMNGGSASSVDNTEIGCFSGSQKGEALLSLSGGATYRCTSNLQMGAGAGGSADDEMKLEIADATMYVAKNSDGNCGCIYINGGSGHIKIGAGGLLDVDGSPGVCIADGGRGYANVGGNFEIVLGDGGTLATHCITNKNSSALQQMTLKFEGGTLKAKSGRDCFVHGADQLAAVTVGEAGGTIDTSGFNVGIQKALSSGTESGTADGGMKFIGGGTATLLEAPAYTGPTVLKDGSALKVPDAASMANILSQGFTVDLTGVTTAYDGMKVLYLKSGAGGAVSASSLANAQAVSNGAEDADYELGVSSDGGAVVLFSKNSSVWTGGGEDNKMSNPANWRNNRVPAAGGQVDFANAPAGTEVDADIEGDPAFSLVTFGDNVVTFTGKLTADDFSDTTKISVGANATVTLKKGITLTGTGKEYILHSIAQGGIFHVGGNVEAAGSGDQMVYGLVDPAENGGHIRVQGSLLCHSQASDRHPFRLGGAANSGYPVKWIVSGMIDGNNIGEYQNKSFFFVGTGSKAEIVAAGKTMNICARIGVPGELTLNTTTPDGDPAVISIDGGSLTREGTVYVKGSGAVQCKYNKSDMQSNSAQTTNFDVCNGATLSFPNGASTYIGTGTKTVKSGCTMSVPVSASVALKGTLVLKDGAILAFHFTEKGVAPAIVDTTAKIDAGAKVYIAMSSDKTAYATVDKYVLLSGLAAGTEASSFAFAPGSQPAWARSLSVETVDGKLCLVLETRKPGTFITLR